MTDTENITDLLDELHAGRDDVLTVLVPKIRRELRRIASRLFGREWGDHIFDPSDLVQEAFCRILIPGRKRFNNREHFFAVAALNIRQLLASHGRAMRAEKRGRGEWIKIDLNDSLPAQAECWTEFLDVDEALQRLEARSPRQSKIVEYRVFGGMSIEEVAHVLGVTEHAVKRDWDFAAAFLRRELKAYRDAGAVDQN